MNGKKKLFHNQLINITAEAFWGCNGRLWHAFRDNGLRAVCGKTVPMPRSTTRFSLPDDDVRCAKCDKITYPHRRDG